MDNPKSKIQNWEGQTRREICIIGQKTSVFVANKGMNYQHSFALANLSSAFVLVGLCVILSSGFAPLLTRGFPPFLEIGATGLEPVILR